MGQMTLDLHHEYDSHSTGFVQSLLADCHNIGTLPMELHVLNATAKILWFEFELPHQIHTMSFDCPSSDQLPSAADLIHQFSPNVPDIPGIPEIPNNFPWNHHHHHSSTSTS